MNYFVSIGDSYSHYWQINILINSFKKLNLQNNLFISVSTDLNLKNNFLDCPNVYIFKNIGNVKQYLKYNKWYCLYQLLNKDILKLPVTVLEPHTALIKDTDSLSGNIIYNINNNFLFNKKYIFENINFENSVSDNWIRLSDNLVFRSLDISFFSNILENMEIYSMFLDDYENLDKFCLMNSIWKNKVDNVVGLNNVESYLPQNELNYILDYNLGFKNIFQKSFFKDKNIQFSGDNIKDLMFKNRFNHCLNFFYSVM